MISNQSCQRLDFSRPFNRYTCEVPYWSTQIWDEPHGDLGYRVTVFAQQAVGGRVRFLIALPTQIAPVGDVTGWLVGVAPIEVVLRDAQGCVSDWLDNIADLEAGAIRVIRKRRVRLTHRRAVKLLQSNGLSVAQAKEVLARAV